MNRRALVAAAGVAAVLGACRPPPRAPVVIENREFDAEIDAEIAAGVPITEESLAAFLSERFARQLRAGTFVADYSGTTEDLLDELKTMGFDDLTELARIVPDDFDIGGAGEFIIEDPANIPGLVRDFLMIHDAERYFKTAWKERWQSILPANVSALKYYVRDFRPFYAARVLTPEEVADAPSASSYASPGAARARP